MKQSRLEIRLTEEEKNAIKEKAEELNLSVSDYARTLLLNGKIIMLSAEERKNIIGIGRNFNQLVRFANARKIINKQVEDEIKEVISNLKKYF